MRVLIIHQNFPGQFKHIAQAWAQRPGWQVLGLGRDTAPGLPNVPWVKYRPHRDIKPEQHPYLRTMENAVLHGQAVLRVLQKLKAKGFQPDAILAHPGWGETLYVKDVFPDARLIHFCEWYYHAEGADLGFDPEHPLTLDDKARIRTWNALHLLNLEHCDVGVTPTRWQHSRHPQRYHDKIVIAHEGIDTDNLGPDPNATFVIPNGPNQGKVLQAGEPIVTYVARNLEPYRGFPQFMRALERIQKEHKTAQALIVGGDEVSYGSRPKDAAHWREKMLREVKLDPSRTHFTGKLPYEQYKRVLQVSAAHVYLTYPFVLSWSMLEAMACGALVVGSDTAPVREVVEDGRNGRLVGFFDGRRIADTVVDALRRPAPLTPLRNDARKLVQENYAYGIGLRRYNTVVAAHNIAVPPTERRPSVANRIEAC
ncbi:MAG: glycosyltransferase family 4 protein [Pseudomonadota bacterium]